MPASQAKSVLRQLGKLVLARRANELPDRELLGRFVDHGDEAAFTTLVERHGAMVLGACRRFLKHAEDSEDAFQAVFLVLARKAASIRKRESLGSWLHGVAIRVARKMSATQRKLSSFTPSPSPPKGRREPVTAESEISLREALVILDEELNRLARGYQAALVLCYLEGKTQDEAARQLGWSQGKLRGQLERGRERLRSCLIRRGVTLPAALLLTALTQSAASAALPAASIACIVKAAVLVAAGKTVGGVVSAKVAALADGAALSMGTAKLAVIAGALLLATLAAGAGFVLCQDAPTKAATAPERIPVVQEIKKLEDIDKPRLDLYGDPLPPGVLKRFGTARLRHAGGKIVGFAHDNTLLSVGGDLKLRFWDMATGKLARTLPGPDTGRLTSTDCAASADGSTVAAFNYRRGTHVTLWDAKTGKERLTIPWKDSRCRLSFAPDGRTLAIAEDRLHLFDPATGQEKIGPWEHGDSRDIPHNSRGIFHIAFSPDSKKITICLSYRWIVLLDAATAKEMHRFEDKDAGCVAFAPNGKCLVTSGGWQRGARIWDPETGKTIGLLRPDVKPAKRPEGPDEYSNWSHLAFSHDGKILATSSAGEPVVLWDFDARKELRRLTTKDGRFAHGQMMFSPDDKTVAGSHHSAIRLWDVATGKELHPDDAHASQIHEIAISPDGRLLLAHDAWDEPARLWDVATSKILNTFDKNRPFAFGADGRTMMARSIDGSAIRQLDASNGKALREFQSRGLRNGLTDMRLSTDGKTLAAISREPNSFQKCALSVWDVETGKELLRRDFETKTHNGEIHVFSPNAKTLARLEMEAPYILIVEDVDSGKSKELGPVSRFFLCFSSDGKLISEVKPDLTVWNVAEGREVASLKAGQVLSTAFSPDSRYIAAAGERTLRLWELASGKEALNFDSSVEKADTSFHSALTYAPDGRSLVSSMYEGNMLMWDLTPDRDVIRKAAGAFAETDLRRLWSEIAGEDAARAYIASHAFTSGPASKTLAFLKDRLSPAKAVEPERITNLIRDLGSDIFAERDAATKELEKSLEDIRSAFVRALKDKHTLETQRRLELLLARPRPFVLPHGDTLRQVRAVAMLERLATPEARQFLDRLANGNPDARLTREASAALARLAGK